MKGSISLLAGFVGTTINVTAAATFGTVADTSTAIPGGTGNFTGFGNATAIDNGHVVFQARGDSGQQGIYHWAGGTLSRVADKTVNVPNGTGSYSFLSFFAYSVSGGRVVFQGAGTDGENGLYAWNGGTLTKLVDHTDAIPGSGLGNYTSFRLPFQAGDSVAFIGYGSSGYAGAFTWSNSVITKIVDSNTPFPGGTGGFGFSSEVQLNGDRAAFWAYDSSDSSRNGIFVYRNGTITPIARTGDTAPGSTQTFSNLQSPPALNGDKIMYLGLLADSTFALFESSLDGVTQNRILDVTTAIPDGTGNFSGFGAMAAEGSTLVFSGFGNGTPVAGLYKRSGGTNTKVIDLSDNLNGTAFSQTSQALKISSRSIHNGELAFIAWLEGGASGVYTTLVGSGGGTTPAAPTLTTSSVTFSANTGFSFQFNGTAGSSYRIEYATGLPASQWTHLTNFTYTAPLTVLDSSGTGGIRFYRAVAE